MRGLSFEQARKRAENPMGVRTAVGARFADDIAQTGGADGKNKDALILSF
jgi:hypothetical protein